MIGSVCFQKFSDVLIYFPQAHSKPDTLTLKAEERADKKDLNTAEFSVGQKAQLDRQLLADSIQHCDVTLQNLSSYITKRIALAEEVNNQRIIFRIFYRPTN